MRVAVPAPAPQGVLHAMLRVPVALHELYPGIVFDIRQRRRWPRRRWY